MSSITDLLAEQVSRVGMGQSERQIGAEVRTTSTTIPATIGALARDRPRRCGAADLHHSLQRHHDGTLLETVDDVLLRPDRGAGNTVIGGILGDEQRSPGHGPGKAADPGSDSTINMFAMLAAIVTGALVKTNRGGGIAAGPPVSILGRMQQAGSRGMPAKERIADRCRAGASEGSIGDDAAETGGSPMADVPSRR